MSKQTTIFAFPIFGLAQLIFLVAKCFGFVSWAWWQVLLPTFIPLGIALALLLVMLALSFLMAWAEQNEAKTELNKWRKK